MAFRSPVRTRSQASERNQNIGNEERTEEAGQSQEDIHILRAEIEALRIELEREKTKHQPQQTESRSAGIDALSQNVANRALLGLLGHFQSMNVEVSVPKFSDSGFKNPHEFIEDVERYFRCKNIRNDQKLIVLETFLRGRARAWFLINRQDCDNFHDFRILFLDEFYSLPVKVRLMNRWRDRRYVSADGSLVDYYYKQVQASRYFEPPMSSYEVNYCIAQQLPARIRDLLSTIDYSNSALMMQVITHYDSNTDYDRGEKEKEGMRRPIERDRSIRRVNRLQSQSWHNHGSGNVRSGFYNERDNDYHRQNRNNYRDLRQANDYGNNTPQYISNYRRADILRRAPSNVGNALPSVDFSVPPPGYRNGSTPDYRRRENSEFTQQSGRCINEEPLNLV